jgi:hypothetical protein
MKIFIKFLMLMAILFVMLPQKPYAQYTICPPEGTIFSIPPEGSTNAYTSTSGWGYFCYQSFHGITGTITSVTFWGVMRNGQPDSFLINICLHDTLEYLPGAVITSIDTSISGVATGEMLEMLYDTLPIYVYSVDVPLTTLEAGWVGIQAQAPFYPPPTINFVFYWLNTIAGEGFPAVQNFSFLPDRVALEMCVIGNVGITEPNKSADSFSLYPNPADNHVYIDSPDELKQVTVYNILGRLVADEITTGRQFELKTSEYSIGIYLVRVETAGGVTSSRLTIRR